MPTLINTIFSRHTEAAQAPSAETVKVPETFNQDIRELGVVPRPLRDEHGQLLAPQSVATRAMKGALELYKSAPPQNPADEDEFYDVICPVEIAPTTQPVQLNDGETYSRNFAERHIKDKAGAWHSPTTGVRYEAATLNVDPSVQHLALYGHLVRHGTWAEDGGTSLDNGWLDPSLPTVPSRRGAYVAGGVLSVLVAAAGPGVGYAAKFLMGNALPTLQLPVCGLGDCGNVATQSFGLTSLTQAVAATGTRFAWSLLNNVNASGQAGIDACRAATQLCWESLVPMQQAFEKKADAHEHLASMIPVYGIGAGLGASALVMAGTWALARHKNRVAQQAHDEAVRAGQAEKARRAAEHADQVQAHQALQARAKQALLADLAELEVARSHQAPKPAASGVEIEMVALSHAGEATETGDEAATSTSEAGPSSQAEAQAGPSSQVEAHAAAASKPSVAMSTNGLRRLQKDLRELTQKSAQFPGVSAAPVGEDLSVWEARIDILHGTLAESAKKFGVDAIKLHIEFPSDYPMAPPKVLIIEPHISHRFNYSGALCADILTPQHWKSAYSVGKLLVQLAEFLHAPELKPKVTTAAKYNLKSAGKFFDSHIVKPNYFHWNH